MAATIYQANRLLAVLRKLFNWCEERGYRPDGTNPCKHVAPYRERSRARFLAEAELARLATALSDAERDGTVSPAATTAVRLLIFTGARRGEILGLRWADVDIERAMLRLPDSKTGAKSVYLSPPALEVLAAIPRQPENPYVIVGRRAGEPLADLNHPWAKIRKRAGLEDVRLHDLRHSFASAGAAGGLSLPVLGGLLGHSQPQTTARYAHLSADPLRQGADLIGRRIAAAMAGGTGGVVVPIGRRGGKA